MIVFADAGSPKVHLYVPVLEIIGKLEVGFQYDYGNKKKILPMEYMQYDAQQIE